MQVTSQVALKQDLKQFEIELVLNKAEASKSIFYLAHHKQRINDKAILIITPRVPDWRGSVSEDQVFHNDIYRRYVATVNSQVDIQLVFPATSKHIEKYTRKSLKLVEETPTLYSHQSEQLLKKELKHLGWVHNILNGTAESERMLYQNQDLAILPDFKCVDLKNIDKIHLLLLFKDPTLHSLRNLTGDHVPLLTRAFDSIRGVLSSSISAKEEDFRIYFHYPPTFYRLHIHILSLGSPDFGFAPERIHLLQTVIQNLKLSSSYYQEATLFRCEERTKPQST